MNNSILLFSVVLGLILSEPGYPGSFTKLLLNFSGFAPSYNGAWWFFTTYVFFVFTSDFWFRLLDTINPFVYLMLLLLVYVVAFYFRIYKTDIFTMDILLWFHKQMALYFCTLFQFMLGAFALKYQWHERICRVTERWGYTNLLATLGILLLIVVHGIVPNFIVAPFTGLAFIFLFLQMDIGRTGNRLLDFFVPHATNMWLIHMFFYMIYFKDFVYGFRYVPLIFLVLIAMCVVSSYIIIFLMNRIHRRV